MSTVAVTGCSGYIGRKVCELLEIDDAVSRVVGVDVRDPAFSTRNLEFYRSDVRSTDLSAVIDGCDAVVHLAAVGGRDAAGVIVGGMRSVTLAAAQVGATKLVFTSSTLVYGGDVSDEDASVRPAPGYAAANVEAEEALRAFAFERRDAVVTILRLAAVSGPSLPAAPIVPVSFAAGALHEDDAARAVVHALKEQLPGTFNVPGERFAATGFATEHTSTEALRTGAEANRGWVTVGGKRFRPAWVAAGSIAALAIGSAARAVSRRAKT